jgi:membrane protein YqaA with SNARE-associated domain
VVSVVDRALRLEATAAVLRFLLSLGVFIGIVSLVGWAFRSELTQFGMWFVARFGTAGMLVGSFLADGIHFPIPPQFYLLTGIAGGHRVGAVVVAVLLGSELGGLTAFSLARVLGRWQRIQRWLAAPRNLLTRMMEKQGYLGLVVAMLLPISYSLLCMASGAMRLSYKAYGVLAVMRVPRILLSYAVIAIAWRS